MIETIYKALSLPQVLYEVDSPINGKISVVQIGHTRKIRVDGVDQSLNWDSPLCKNLYWGRTVSLLQKEIPELPNILVLGLGGGTMQHLISQSFPATYIVSVDLDPVMIDVANKYFGVSEIPNHRIINADALRVVVNPSDFDLAKASFHVVVVDIFVGENYPDLGSSGNFIGAVKDLVIPGGLVIFNRIYTEKHHEDVDNFIEQLNGFLTNIKTEVVAGYTNSDSVLIYGRVFEHSI